MLRFFGHVIIFSLLFLFKITIVFGQLLNFEELAEKHKPVIILSGKGKIGVDLTNNDCYEYDYKPIPVQSITTNSLNLPKLKSVDGSSVRDLSVNDFDVLGKEKPGTYVDIDSMFITFAGGPPDYTVVDDVYCDLPDRPTGIYYQVFHNPLETFPIAIQYWFFYFFNDWVGDHPGDWETITVFFNSKQIPQEVVYSTHYEANRYQWGAGDMVYTDPDGKKDRPQVIVSNGGHGSYAYKSETQYSSLGVWDNHLGNKTTLVDIDIYNLKTIVQNTSSWFHFDGRWGNNNKAPRGPKFRKDANSEIPWWSLSNKSNWELARNKPYFEDECIPRIGRNIYSEDGPWGWAKAYRLDWSPGDPCIAQPKLVDLVEQTTPLVLKWKELKDENGIPVDYYSVIVRSSDGKMTYFDEFAHPTCVSGTCSKTIYDIDLVDGKEYYWFIRGNTILESLVSSPWSDRGSFIHGEVGKCFSDIGDYNYLVREAICDLKNLGVIDGSIDDTTGKLVFNGNHNILRQEVFKIVSKLSEQESGIYYRSPNPFMYDDVIDMPTDSFWWRYFAEMLDKGIITGDISDGEKRVRPTDFITYGEITKIIVNIFKGVNDIDKSGSDKGDGANEWPCSYRSCIHNYGNGWLINDDNVDVFFQGEPDNYCRINDFNRIIKRYEVTFFVNTALKLWGRDIKSKGKNAKMKSCFN